MVSSYFTKLIPLQIVFLLVLYTTEAQLPFFKAHEILKDDDLKIQTTFQDKNGFIWVGTSKGLFKFDGHEFIQFNQIDSTASNHVYSIAEDLEGRLWIGYKSGHINLLQGKRLIPFNPPEGTPAVEIMDILVDKDSVVWLATYGEGVYYYKNKRLYNISMDDGLGDDYTYQFVSDSQLNVWVGTDGGLSVCKLNENGKKLIKNIDTSQGLPDNLVKAVYLDYDSLLWLGMEGEGIIQYSIRNNQFISPEGIDKWKYGAVNSITLQGSDIWIGTDRKGIVSYDSDYKTVSIYDRKIGLPSNKIKHFLNDNEGNVWITTEAQLVQSSGNRFEVLKNLEEDALKNIQTVLVDEEHRVWLGNPNGLYHIELTEQSSTILSIITDLNVLSLYQDKYNYLWVGTFGKGVYRYNPKTGWYQTFSTKNGLPNEEILSIEEDRNGNIFLSTFGGVAKFTLPESANSDIDIELSFENYGKQDGLGSEFIYSTYADSKNRIWFASDGSGISKLENDEFTIYNKDQGIKGKVFYSIVEDGFGNIWFSTANEGIYRYNNQEFENFKLQTVNGKEILVRSIDTDPFGNLVIIHSEGLGIFNIKNETYNDYGSEVGIIDMSPSLNSFFKDGMGKIWIGTDKGLLKYSPHLETIQRVPITNITSVNVLLNEIDFEEVNSFSHRQNHFTFNYKGLWFTDPTKVTYQFKLENYDLDWITSTNSSATYSNLPPGSYIFKLQSSNNDYFQNAVVASYAFEVKPPFWQTTWFYILVVFLAALIFTLFVKIRERNLKRAKQELEQEVHNRTQEILNQKEEIAAQAQQLHQKSSRLEVVIEDLNEKNKSITSSINYARRIQRALLTSSHTVKTLFPESIVFYIPKDIVSGDFYWCYQRGNLRYIAAIDCTGHGVPGALMSMIGNTILNEIIELEDCTNTNIILDLLNKRIKEALQQKQEDGTWHTYDGMDIGLCCYNTENRTLQFSGAKRPLYLLKDGNLKEIKGDKTPIGAGKYYDGHQFTSHTIQIEKGTTFYLSSDGYADQFGGNKNRKFMIRRLKDFLIKIHGLPFEDQEKELEKAFQDWKGEYKQTDDILIIGFRL